MKIKHLAFACCIVLLSITTITINNLSKRKGAEGESTVHMKKPNIDKSYSDSRESLSKTAYVFPEYDGTEELLTNSTYDSGSSTYYVANRMKQLGVELPSYLGNADQWSSNIKLHSDWTIEKSDPSEGDIVCFSKGTLGANPTFGHVAFLEKIEKNNIIISETLNDGKTVSYRAISFDKLNNSGVSFIRQIHLKERRS